MKQIKLKRESEWENSVVAKQKMSCAKTSVHLFYYWGGNNKPQTLVLVLESQVIICPHHQLSKVAQKAGC